MNMGSNVLHNSGMRIENEYGAKVTVKSLCYLCLDVFANVERNAQAYRTLL